MLKLFRSGLFGHRNRTLKNKILIREVNSNDEPKLLVIRNNPENYKWFFHDSTVTIEEHASWFKERLLKASHFTLVAEIEGDIIGTAYLSNMHAIIPSVSISILPGMKGLGIGTKLLQELVAKSKSLNIEAISAEIKASNVASIEFFYRNGFVEIKKQTELLDDFNSDRVLLHLNLSV